MICGSQTVRKMPIYGLYQLVYIGQPSKSVLFSGREEVMGRELDDPVNSKPPITAATRVLPTKFNMTRRPITWQLWMSVKVKGIEREK